MNKLTGGDYIAYWEKRIARGPDEVAYGGKNADQNGEMIWSFLLPSLLELQPRSIIDFGCGWGRMTAKLRNQFSDARITGIDLCAPAVDSVNARLADAATEAVRCSSIPAGMKVDLLFDCTVLQHVTDNLMFARVCSAFRTALNPGGSLFLFENTWQPKAHHVRDMVAADYMGLWGDLRWSEPRAMDIRGETHTLMVGTA